MNANLSTSNISSCKFSMLFLLFVIFFILLNANSVNAQDEYIKVPDVKIQMYDGTCLMANIYLPDTLQKYPTILVRNPYNKDYLGIFGETFVKYGYAVVVQDVRGKYASEGIFTVFADERKDGLATLDWIVEQPWSDGKIGMYGPSYLSYCSQILASENHPALKTIVVSSGISNIYQLMYFDGSYNQTMAIWMKRRGTGKIDYNGIFRLNPLNQMIDSIMEPHARTIMNHDTRDLFHKNMSVENYDKINIPILHSTGWNDYMYRSTIDLYRKVSENNSLQKIFIGPWTHNQQLNAETSNYGDEDFGESSLWGFIKDVDISVRWFDYHIKGINNGIMEEPKAKYFIMGKNEWRTSEQFPPKNTKPLHYYLGSKKGANSSNGDGVLSIKKNKNNDKDIFVFDPENPVPTIGGVNSHMLPELMGIKDQSEVEKRNDVLVYTTDEFINELEIAGEIKVKLYISTDVTDTDFTAKLVEVRENGYARIIEDGIAKTRFINGFDKKEAIVPGKIYEVEIIVGTTAISIPKGSKLRLEISSSNFPKFPRNHNTGENETNAVSFKKATQTIWHSEQYPSQLILPVLTGK